MQGLGVDFVKTASLGSLIKVQLEVEKSYDRQNFWQVGTGLDLDQLLFNTPILITPRTWRKNKTNKLLQNLGRITPMHERNSSLKKTHTSKLFLREHMKGLFWVHFCCFDFF
jgi:hypothetical protein